LIRKSLLLRNNHHYRPLSLLASPTFNDIPEIPRLSAAVLKHSHGGSLVVWAPLNVKRRGLITLERFGQGIPVGSQGLGKYVVLFLLLMNLLLWIIHVIIGTVVGEVHNWLR
jgi:hypothetical protein